MNVWTLHATLMPRATTVQGVTPVNVLMGFLGMDLIALVCLSVCMSNVNNFIFIICSRYQ